MASLFTNASAQTALATLSSASKNLASTQNRVSTGLRINTAEDNAAYWSIATTLRSDVGALGAVQDALGLGAATVDVVYTGLNSTKDLLDQIKTKLVAATTSGVPREQIQAEISQLQNRLSDSSRSTVINGESWLTQDSSEAGYNSNKAIVGSFTRTGGVVTVDTIDINIGQTKLYELSTAAHDAVTDVATGSLGAAAATWTAFATAVTAAPPVQATVDAARLAYEVAAVGNATTAGDAANAVLGIFDKVRTIASDADGTNIKAVSVSNIDISKLTDTDFDKSTLKSFVKAVDDALQELTLSASVVGAAKARVEGNRTFVKNLIDANNRGIGQLVDADLNEESTKLKALQVQEQLAIQSLTIANNSTQNILSLFR